MARNHFSFGRQNKLKIFQPTFVSIISGRKPSLILLAILIHLGTTYVVRENGIEVGRWTENDGKNRIEEINQEKRKTPPPESRPQAPKFKPFPVKYEWYYDREGYEKGIRRQKEKKVPIFLYFHAVWCPVCTKFNEGTFASPQVQKFLAPFVKVKIDAEQEKDLASQYKVTGYPTFIVLSPAGKKTELSRYFEPKDFIEECQTAGLVV